MYICQANCMHVSANYNEVDRLSDQRTRAVAIAIDMMECEGDHIFVSSILCMV